MAIRETMREAGYRYAGKYGYRSHKLLNLDTGLIEVWFPNINHASYGIRWRNTDLEFAFTITDSDKHNITG